MLPSPSTNGVLALAAGLTLAASPLSAAFAGAQDSPELAPASTRETSGGGGGPNFVFILIDDLGWRDVSCMGSGYYETPNIDRLAAQGVRFTNAYANAPNCAPSRACLLTGQYGPRHGIYTVNSAHRGKAKHRRLICPENDTTLDGGFTSMGEMFQSMGYDTAAMGKWHLGEGAECGPEAQGFALNVGGTRWGHPKTYFSPYRNPKLEDGPKGEYLTDRLTDEAIAFITEDRGDQPFLLYLSHYAVHTPIQAKAELTEHYKGKEPVGGQDNAKYAAMIQSVDEGVGRIVRALIEHDLDDDTIIIVTSDNGGHGGVTSNAPLRGGKGMLYEGGVRVPMIIAWPGRIPAGVTCNTPVIGVDMIPTMLSLSGLPSPAAVTLDGVDLSPLLLGVEDAADALKGRPLYWHFPAYLEAGGAAPGIWRTTPASVIRIGDWKLIEFFEDGRLELYNLADDVGETTNLIEDHPQRAATMHEQLEAWRAETNAAIPHELNPTYEPPAKIDQAPADGVEAPVERTP
jgi:arylsulfatase A-like enzyme